MDHTVSPPQGAERVAECDQREESDTALDKALDGLALLAAYVCQASIAIISLVDSDRRWLRSKIELTATQASHVIAFCSQASIDDGLVVIPDAQADARFAAGSFVAGEPHIRFYCGVPLKTSDGYRIGVLSVIDQESHNLSIEQIDTLWVLSQQVMTQLDGDRRYKELLTVVAERIKTEQTLLAVQEKFQQLSDYTSAGIYIYAGERLLYTNRAASTITGYSVDELQSMSLWDLAHPDFHAVLKARLRVVEGGDTAASQLEFPIISKGGQVRWLDCTTASIDFEGKSARIGTAYDITERRHTQALIEVQRKALEMVAQNKPLTETMEVLVRSIEALSDGAVCTILLVDPTTNTLHRGAVSTMPETYCRAVEGAPVGPQVGSCGTAAYQNATVIVTDIASDPFWAPWPEARELALSHGLKACTSMPIRNGRGEVLGTYAMYYRANRGPTAFEEVLLMTSSHLLGIAIENIRTNEALLASEARFRALSESAATAIYVHQHSKIVYANPAALAISGYPFDELQAMPLWRMVHPEFRDQAKAQFAAIERGEQVPSRLEFPIIRKDGVIRWIDFSAATILLDGQPARIGSATDITERKLAEACERARLERVIRLQAAQLKLVDQLVYEDLSQDYGIIVKAVAEALEVERVGLWLFNQDRSALVCHELYRRSQGNDHAEAVLEVSRYPTYFSALDQVLSVEAPTALNDDATKELVEGYLLPLGIVSMLDAPIRYGGRTIGVLCCEQVREPRSWTAEETSFVAAAADHVVLSLAAEDRRKATDALRASEARFALAVRGANDGIWDSNLVMNEHYLSPRCKELLGFSDDEVPNQLRSFFNLLHSDDRPGVQDAVRAHLTCHVPCDLEIRLRHKDGFYRWFRLRGQAQWDENGRPFRMAGAITDITDRRRTFDALNDAYRSLRVMSRAVQVAQERERTRLSRELHDEFGQLLSVLKVTMSRLTVRRSEHPTSSTAVRAVAATAVETVDRLFASLREMIQGLRPAVLDKLGLVAAVESLVSDLLEHSKLRCRVIADSGKRRTLFGDELEGALYRMVQELLMNIVRHAQATSVTITLRSIEGDAQLTVQDDGRGFDLVKARHKGRHGLLGIRERAELLGGTVEIQSAPCKGTCVTVTIPIAPQNEGR